MPEWRPEVKLHGKCRVNVSNYGLDTYGDLFTPRQLVALTTFSDLVQDAISRCRHDAVAAGVADDGVGLDAGGCGATAYAEAVAVYLGLAVDKTTDYNSSLVAWSPTRDQAKTTFGRQALPMIWDFAEINTFAGAAGDIAVSIEGICRSVGAASSRPGHVQQAPERRFQRLRNRRSSKSCSLPAPAR